MILNVGRQIVITINSVDVAADLNFKRSECVHVYCCMQLAKCHLSLTPCVNYLIEWWSRIKGPSGLNLLPNSFHPSLYPEVLMFV